MPKKQISTSRDVEDDFLRVRISTLDKKETDVLIIDIFGFITPLREKDYTVSMNLFEKCIRNVITEEIKCIDEINKKHIVVFDISTDRMKANKPSYFSLQCVLSLKESMPFEDAFKEYMHVAHNFSEAIRAYFTKSCYIVSRHK